MTDPEIADRTYIEPLDPAVVAKILERERPDALLPTLGGQTALNLALALEKDGTLSRLGIALIGANGEAIRKAEDRLLFKEAMADGARWGRAPQWVIPHFKQPVFDGAAFPSFGYDQHGKIEQLVGRTTIKIDYYDPAYNKVTSADKPGRYGAVAVVTGETGATFTAYRTLFRRPTDGAEASGGNAVTLAAQFEGKPSGDAPKVDTDWWHGLRKTLGTAVKYDYFVRTPSGYDTDKAKRWPIIYFLHGSGGGDGQNMSGIVNGGVQIAAQKDPNFPFIAVSLRSPGGWSPPAVKDVMDEVDAQYRTDQDRQYLTGFSMGGMGTWSVAFDQPARFAAISPVGGRQGQPDKAALLKDVAVWGL